MKIQNLINIYDFKTSTSVSVLGTSLSYLFGGYDDLIKTLMLFILIDFITGLLNAFYKGSFISSEMRKGLVGKTVMFLIIVVSVRIDILFNLDSLTRTCVCYFYIANEGLSILENLDKIGVPFPNFIKNRFETMKDNSNKGETTNENK